ncbi:MAG: thiamine pyrophosphate-dependent dehydrogenase E1 component subunit alpha [Candidatus Omnitrophica bacterium]|nr:thiamine pyrophosphate-dependent dehydrogenase E1 component subunit alpha [Candidatus Omnitrophota bacterium]
MILPGAVLSNGVLTKGEALALYRKMLLGRLAEEKIREEYPKDHIKTAAHLGIGAEAVSAGVCHCLPPDSKTFGTYRNHMLYLAVTEDTDGFFAELYGKASGPSKGKAGSMHIVAPEKGLMATSAVVGTTIPLAVGAALAKVYKNEPGLVAVFFGDGAIEEGVFWESLNFAALKKLPVLFVCEDNGLAIHTHASERQGFRSIPEAVGGFQCHAAGAEAYHVADVVTLTRQVLKAMAQAPQPGFIHLKYFRFLEHVGPGEDFEAGYRRRPTPEEREWRDPILRMEKEIRSLGFTDGDLEAVKKEVGEKIRRSVEAAQQAPFPPSSELYTDVLA